MLYKFYHNREQHKVRQRADCMYFINSYKMDNEELIISTKTKIIAFLRPVYTRVSAHYNVQFIYHDCLFGISRQTLQYLLDGNKTD